MWQFLRLAPPAGETISSPRPESRSRSGLSVPDEGGDDIEDQVFDAPADQAISSPVNGHVSETSQDEELVIPDIGIPETTDDTDAEETSVVLDPSPLPLDESPDDEVVVADSKEIEEGMDPTSSLVEE